MRGRDSPKGCRTIPVVEITITGLKDVWEPKANPTILVDEKNGELKCSLLDVSANVVLLGWDPSALGYDCTLSFLDAEVQC
jgi:hypothetical protein